MILKSVQGFLGWMIKYKEQKTISNVKNKIFVNKSKMPAQGF